MIEQSATQQAIVLVVQDAEGKGEIGHITLDEFYATPAGESEGFSVRADLTDQMAELTQTVSQVLTQEGFTPVQDSFDLQITISRALMTTPSGDIQIPVPVRERGQVEPAGPDPLPSPVPKSPPPTPQSPDVSDDLFNLNDL